MKLIIETTLKYVYALRIQMSNVRLLPVPW